MRNVVAKNYGETFDARGDSYDEAMRMFPEARANEFATILDMAALKDGERVCDFPSGGGYIGNYIRQDVDLTLLESSKLFFDLCARAGKGRAVLTRENVIPFNDGHFDKIISLAGVHHNPDQPGLFAECARALKPGGTYCVADVWAGSAVDGFLNEFVDAHNEDGHDGVFFNENTVAAVAATGLTIRHVERISYPWAFTSKEEMVRFCHMLFKISKASPSMVLKGIESYLGYTTLENGIVLMNWELFFIKAVKPAR